MLLVLQRCDLTDERTIGTLHADGAFVCYTLEDRVRQRDDKKVPGRTAIPAGMYQIQLTWSPRFLRDLPLIKAVPGFEGIRVHAGNSAQDTDGCVLVGLTRSKDTILDSRAALEKVVRLIESGDRTDAGCWIDVRNPLPKDDVVISPEVQ